MNRRARTDRLLTPARGVGIFAGGRRPSSNVSGPRIISWSGAVSRRPGQWRQAERMAVGFHFHARQLAHRQQRVAQLLIVKDDALKIVPAWFIRIVCVPVNVAHATAIRFNTWLFALRKQLNRQRTYDIVPSSPVGPVKLEADGALGPTGAISCGMGVRNCLGCPPRGAGLRLVLLCRPCRTPAFPTRRLQRRATAIATEPATRNPRRSRRKPNKKSQNFPNGFLAERRAPFPSK